MERVSNNFSL